MQFERVKNHFCNPPLIIDTIPFESSVISTAAYRKDHHAFTSDDLYVCPFCKTEHLRTMVLRPVVAASLEIVGNADSQAPLPVLWSQKIGECGEGQILVLTSPPPDFDEHSSLGTSTGSVSYVQRRMYLKDVIRMRKYK